MDKWILNFWDILIADDDEGFKRGNLEIRYDSSEYFKCNININFIENDAKAYNASVDFIVENRNNGMIVINEDVTLILSTEQRDQLFSISGKWEYKSLNTPIKDVNTWVAGVSAKDFGIVYFYSYEKEKFVAAQLLIDFDWSSSEPILILVKTYDDSMMPELIFNSRNSNLNYTYQGVINGLTHLLIGGNYFLLNDKQVELINHIIAIINNS